MLLKATSPLLDWTGEAVITYEHPASSDGKPVLLVEGKPIDPCKADWADYEILKATPIEIEMLRQGNYLFRGGRKRPESSAERQSGLRD